MLEPYAVKVARTVLRRGRASNRSFLFDYEFPIIWVGSPQGPTTAQRVAETVKSECQPVMDWIEVQTLPQPERVQTCQRCFIV